MSMTPDEAEMVAAGLDLAAGGVVAVSNGVMTKVHSPSACAGYNCWVHNPSAHAMASWPVRWRPDTRTAERLCPHDLGHPDPDDVAFNRRTGRDTSRHGCDGCCGC